VSEPRYVRAADVDEESFEDDLLLFQRAQRTVVSLNSPAACLWQALEWPQSERGLAALLVEAGVAEPRATETAATLLHVLVEQGFVTPVPACLPAAAPRESVTSPESAR
jgi:hypothetical protein